MSSLSGISVVVAGAGLAGLSAAHDLLQYGARVTVIDARDRVGGRVHTIRAGFADGQHAEAGGDMIDDSHAEIRALARDCGLTLTRILRNGFGMVRVDRQGRPQIVQRSFGAGWDRMAASLADVVRAYRLAEQRWDTPIAASLARRSVNGWLDEVHADAELRAAATSLRGFFLADPEELSLIALVDQFGSDHDRPDAFYRIDGGNDRLPAAIAAKIGGGVHLKTELVAVSQRGSTVRLTVKSGGAQSQLTCDYVVVALPATLLRRVPFHPALPSRQHDAFARLRYGKATKTLLQFSARFWRTQGRPRAFGSPLAFGALWEGNEEQRGRAGILSLLAGGGASDATQALVARDGPSRLVEALSWLGAKPADLIGSHKTVWEDDPFARGGYAFFDPAFDPELRAWLARPTGRLFFAGEHTSIRWQGYMNGAVESGRRAAAEVVATHAAG